MNNTLRLILSASASLLVFAGCLTDRPYAIGDIVIENDNFRFVVGTDAIPKSLVAKPSGEELLDADEGLPLWSVTQHRPFNNEIKLVFPNKQTTYRANRVRRDGDFLVVGFEHVSYEAKIKVDVAPGYALFTLDDFILGSHGSNGLRMTYPPVKSLRMLDLPVKCRGRFGEWMNSEWDDTASVAVMAAEPMVWIDSEKRRSVRHLTADAHADLKLRGASAALIASDTGKFLDCIDSMERALGLPLGVESRRRPELSYSVYWTSQIAPDTVDAHIEYAKKGGFRHMLIYYPAVFKGAQGDSGYCGIGDYELKDEYGGIAGLKAMLDKIKAAGITPGLHVLHTFIGFKTRYVTPSAHPMLNLTRHFTLQKPLGKDGGDVYVQEDPSNCPTNSESRVLKFAGELMSYEGYTTARPFKFTGVKRGHLETTVVDHPCGEIGGILDVCEFGARSCYIDQKSDLQDEIAEKIARAYDAGFEFMYFDGSEGVNVPQGIHVPNAQYRVWSRLGKKPLFTEGAAKGHFGWHHLSGANAFDVFAPEIFKKMIVRWPLYEAPIMRNDFTRVNFGWWGLYLPGQSVKLKDRFPYESATTIGTQYDMWEFGTSRAAAWDCPATIQFGLQSLEKHPRMDDLLEVMRRWEDVRVRKWLTPQQKEMLKSPDREHHLYMDGNGNYELHEISMLPTPERAPMARGFMFERNGKRVIACWHTHGEGKVAIGLGKGEDIYALSGIRYIETDLSADDAMNAWSGARAL